MLSITDITRNSAKQTIVDNLPGLFRVAHNLLPHMSFCVEHSGVAESIASGAGFG